LTDGTETDLGGGGLSGANLAFDASDTLWFFYDGEQGTVDATTGIFTDVWAASFGNDILGVTFLDGLMWLLVTDGSTGGELWTMNMSTGATVDIGPFATTDLDALAWAVV
jgi:hypothetical protein